MEILFAWLINAISLLVLPYVVPAVSIKGFATALVAALVIGLLNALVRPVLVVLTLPINVLTLGLFILVINGAMFWLAAHFLEDFSVRSFGWAIVGAVVYSLISWATSTLLLRRR